MATFERAKVVSYRLSIVTVAQQGVGHFWAQISGCSPWSRSMMFGSAESERPRLTNREIIFEEFQRM